MSGPDARNRTVSLATAKGHGPRRFGRSGSSTSTEQPDHRRDEGEQEREFQDADVEHAQTLREHGFGIALIAADP